MTIIWIIIIIIAFIAIRFFVDMNKQKDHVAKQGGMRHKYRVLINELLSQDARCKIYQETTTFISLGVSGVGGSTMFFLQQTFGKITIQWKVNSPMFGKHQLEWVFDEFGDQEKMLLKINNDVEAYSANTLTKYF